MSARNMRSGSMPVGPSDDYMALLRGEITPEEYVRRLKTAIAAAYGWDVPANKDTDE